MTAMTAAWYRVLGVLGRFSMYWLTALALAALTLVALVLSVLGELAARPLEIAASLLVLLLACVGVNAACQAVLRLPQRLESSVITGMILLFVLRPTTELIELAWLACAGAIAMLSKYVLAWRGRHIFNPAAVGAAVVTLAGVSPASWWVGTPLLAAPVLVFGLIVLLRVERVRLVAFFVLLVVCVAVVRLAVAGLPSDEAITFAIWQSPFLFLGVFMLSEPATLPPRRWQQFTVATVVALLAGWPIDLGAFTLGQERALLIGNLVGFVWMQHRGIRLTFAGARAVTPTIRELTFTLPRPMRFAAGQYLQLTVPHRRPDVRGTRREFSIVSSPGELGVVRLAYRMSASPAGADGGRAPRALSSFKRALAVIEPGTVLSATGVSGDFLLPTARSASVLLVAAGIGITPFVSQLATMRSEVDAGADPRDIVLVYVASEAAELAFRDEIEASGVPVVVFTRDRPLGLPANWQWAGGVRLDAAGLASVVPELRLRHAYVSGAPGLIAELAPALEVARSVTTDAFAGYSS